MKFGYLCVMELGDLAWDYTDAYDDRADSTSLLHRKIVIVLEFPHPRELGRSAKVLTLDGAVKQVPVEFLSSVW